MALVLGNATPTSRIPAQSRFGPPPFRLDAHEWWRVRAREWVSNRDWQMAYIEMAATPGGPTQCTGGTAFANSGTAANAFTSNLAVYWRNSSYAVNGYIGYHFPSPVVVQELRMTAQSSGAVQSPIYADLEYSDDGVTFYNFAALNDTTWTNSQVRTWTFTASLANSSTVWRNYTVYATSSSDLTLRIWECAFAATVGGATLCVGGTPSGNTYFGAGNDPINAFDNNPATRAQWLNFLRANLTYTFLTAVSVREMRITGDPAGGSTVNAQDLNMQLPDGANSWRTVGSSIGLTWTANETKSVVLT